MAYVKKGIFVFKGDFGGAKSHIFITTVENILDTTYSITTTLANNLKSKSLCNIASCSMKATNVINDSYPDTDANVDCRAVIYFRHPTRLTQHHVVIPSPIASMLEETKWGKRVKSADVTAIVGFINTATGISYIPLYGTYEQKR